ncbi:shikimate dehydrogenase [Candidatus Woesearchaeota archaeon]|nr:shikimate dehydrogenase [Candidatus Woesearchaeota archaeon]
MSSIDQYAVFGHPINHSLSPEIHARFAAETGQSMAYARQDITPEQFAQALTDFLKQGGKGLNCTVPLKELAYAVCDRRSPGAERARAVNTLMRGTNGQLYGDNTDGTGLVRDLTRNLSLSLKGLRILLIGAGGASRGVLFPLLEQQPGVLVLTNRTLARAEQMVAEFSDLGRVSVSSLQALGGQTFDLILNATAASLTGELPDLPDHLVAEGSICYDLAYSAKPTAFVQWGIRAGAARSVDGIGMLVEQAADAFELWRGVRPHTAAVIAGFRQKQTHNPAI